MRSLTWPLDEPNCYASKVDTVTLASGVVKTYPICREIADGLVACYKSMPNNNNKRKCEGFNYETVKVLEGNKEVVKPFARNCTCAP